MWLQLQCCIWGQCFQLWVCRVFQKHFSGGGGEHCPPIGVGTWCRRWGKQLAYSGGSSLYQLMSTYGISIIYKLFFILIDLIMPGVTHGFDGSCLFFILDVIKGRCLLYKKLILLRNNSKDKSVSFLYILR